MNLTNFFNIRRFWLLLKMELYRSRKGVVMTFVIAFGLLFFFGLLLAPLFEPSLEVYDHVKNFTFPLLVGGFILSSLAFSDLSNTLKRYNYLTLPVSTFERFLSMWLLTSIGWIVLFTITFTCYTWFANFIGPLVFRDITFLRFDPAGDLTMAGIKYYFVLQGVFLVGASRFKAYVFPKTLFTLILSGMVCGVIVYLVLVQNFNSDAECLTDPDLFAGTRIAALTQVLQWTFWWLLAPLCWVITYLGLKEKEV